VVATQEEERRRLARELHDETGQALTGLAISLKLLTDSLPPDAALARQRAAELITLSSTTMDQIRLLAQDLRPPALDTVGLNLTLDGLCRGFASRTGLEISYTGTGLPELPEAATIALYRFVQEALTNVAKHSGAKHIDVVLAYDAEAVTVSVEDDGAGFDMHAVLSGAWHLSGMGLVGMQERLSGLGGRLVIDTQPGQGTRLVAYVPQEEIL
jgi:signal transduction histidine kinase